MPSAGVVAKQLGKLGSTREGNARTAAEANPAD